MWSHEVYTGEVGCGQRGFWQDFWMSQAYTNFLKLDLDRNHHDWRDTDVCGLGVGGSNVGSAKGSAQTFSEMPSLPVPSLLLLMQAVRLASTSTANQAPP